jgi:hypothetical protein
VANSFQNFQTTIWVLKSRISNFKPKFNWGQTRINSNKLFGILFKSAIFEN